MSRVSVLWFDPGGTTGAALCSIGVKSLLNGDVFARMRIDTSSEIKGPEDQQAQRMLFMAQSDKQIALGIESFVLHKFIRSVELLSPVRIRAKYEFGLYIAGEERRVFFQSPSDAMTTLTDDRQRRNDLWIKGADHRRVAVKHCATFFLRAQNKGGLRRAAWPHIDWAEEVRA